MVTFEGLLTEVRAVSAKVFSRIVVILPDNVTDLRAVHIENAYLPRLVTLPGIFIVVRLLQRWKAKSPIFVTVVGIVMLAKRHWKNAPLLMVCIPSGIVIEVREVQFANTPSPKTFTGRPLIFDGILRVSAPLPP